MKITEDINEAFTAKVINGAVEERKVLRHAALPILSRFRKSIRRAFSNNPEIVAGKRSTRPTPSGLRDALPSKVLALLVSETITISAVLQAISLPDTHAETDDDGNPLFGVPLLDDTVDSLYQTLHDKWAAETTVICDSDIKPPEPEPTPEHDTKPATTATEHTHHMKIDIDTSKRSAINGVLDMAGLPPIETWQSTLSDAERQIEDLKAQLASAATVSTPASGEIIASHDIPKGSWEFIDADKALSPISGGGSAISSVLSAAGKLPKFTWEHDHPMVPEIDPHYKFRADVLMPLIFSLQSNKRSWLYGHSGTGKTSALEQVCARLGMPLITVSMDSDVSRMDLMGRDTLVSDGSASKSIFVEGVLPRWLKEPCVMLFDEIDYGRPDVMYVLQRALEHKALVVEEDGNRVVNPHPLNRIVATGNTKGGGDESGLYPGSRVQSAAFLNRFTNWIEVGYMSETEEVTLLNKRVPGIPHDVRISLKNYIKEHRHAFHNAEIMQPISPRNITAMGEAFVFAKKFDLDDQKALTMAFEWTIFGLASSQDAVVMKGIANRTLSLT